MKTQDITRGPTQPEGTTLLLYGDWKLHDYNLFYIIIIIIVWVEENQ
jgi:hypothetical protein